MRRAVRTSNIAPRIVIKIFRNIVLQIEYQNIVDRGQTRRRIAGASRHNLRDREWQCGRASMLSSLFSMNNEAPMSSGVDVKLQGVCDCREHRSMLVAVMFCIDEVLNEARIVQSP